MASFLSSPAFLIFILSSIAILALIAFRLYRRQPALDLASVKETDELDLNRRLGNLRYIDTPSGQIAVRQIGSGPDILCLHGIGASMMIFRKLVPLLAVHYRVTCLDFLGFGDSDKPTAYSYELDHQAEALTTAAQILALKKPLIVASSMGAAIALASVRLKPWARAIVALAPATDPRQIPSILLPLAERGEKLVHLHFGTRLTVDALVKRVVSKRELVTQSVVDAYHRPFRENPHTIASFFKSLRLLGDARMPGMFANILVPVLVLYGKKDRMVREHSCRALVDTVQNGTLITHPTGGHHLMEDEPEWVAEKIQTFESQKP